MGAWGTGIFDDDTARDFLGELAGSKKPLDLMKRVLEDAPGSEYLEYDAGQSVLVSSAVIDTILSGTRHGDDLEELDVLVKKHKPDDASPLKSFAVAAIRRVLADASELGELWAENAEEYPKWRSSVEALAARLDG
jgi:hypothetical protein